MPWALAYMASIQVGSLKAYLSDHGIEAIGGHWFLDVANALGHEAYGDLCYPFLTDGEALYAYLLFPEIRSQLLADDDLRRAFSRAAARQPSSVSIKLALTHEFFEQFSALHSNILDRYDWGKVCLLGLSLNFGQTLSSLYIARQVKARSPDTKVVIGGSEASGELGNSLLENFPFIDYACNGEGELPLLALSRALICEGSTTKCIPGMSERLSSEQILAQSPAQMPKLNLPTPDYDEYFQTIVDSGLQKDAVTSCLPVEGSRGCYFSCSFCALNLQWSRYRAQDGATVKRTISDLVRKYQILDLFFVDNIAPPTARKMFRSIGELGLDLRFFYEMRTDIKLAALVEMKIAGLSRVQLGIEALSTSLLSKFNKKVRVIDNLQGMKFCEELEIFTCGNLILNHPKASDEDVSESASMVEFCSAFRPPNAFAPFDLEFGAPDYEGLDKQWILIEGNHAEYKRIYPSELFQRLRLLRRSYTPLQEVADWEPLIQQVERWRNSYQTNCASLGPTVRHRTQFDGGSFLRMKIEEADCFELTFSKGRIAFCTRGLIL